MKYLLDINLLIALAWPSHIHHAMAQKWFKKNRHHGWSTCPITQTGFVRISSNPKFIDGAVSPGQAIRLLQKVTQSDDHTFWPDSIKVTDENNMLRFYILGHRQITDAYLLALVISRKGQLATLDKGIAALLPDADLRTKHLELILA